MSPRRLQTIGLAVVGLSVATALGLHAYLGHFSRYIADDYCSAAMAQRLGLPRAVWYWYLNWTGRYSASALDAAAGIMGPALAPYLPALAILAWLAAATYAIAGMLMQGRESRLYTAAVIAGALIYLTLLMSPNVAQALHWGQGMRSIIPPVVLSTVLMGCLVRVARNAGTAQPWLLFAGCGSLALIVGGFNETIAALQLGVLACLLFLALVRGYAVSRKAAVQALIASTVGAGLALTIVSASPGNAIRQAFYPPPPGVPALLSMAWHYFTVFLTGVWDTPAKLLATLGAIGLGVFVGLHAEGNAPRPSLIPAVLAAGFFLAFTTFWPAAYAISDAPPERTLLIPSLLLAISILLGSSFLGAWLASRAGGDRRAGILKSTTILAAAAMIMGSTALVDAGLIRTVPIYRAYAEHWQELDAEIRLARQRGQSEVWIQPSRNWAGLNEPNDNPRFWLNRCISQYYGISVYGRDLP